MALLVATTDEWEPPKPTKAGTPLLLRLYYSGVALDEPVTLTLRSGTTVLGRQAQDIAQPRPVAPCRGVPVTAHGAAVRTSAG